MTQVEEAADWRLAAAKFLRDEDEQRKHIGWANRGYELLTVAEKLEGLASAFPYGLDAGDDAPSPPESAPSDTTRMDWLSRQAVAVCTPLEDGSQLNFVGSPDNDTWDLRSQIDRAMAAR